MAIRHGEGEEIGEQKVNSQNPAALASVICLLRQVNPEVDSGCTQ